MKKIKVGVAGYGVLIADNGRCRKSYFLFSSEMDLPVHF